MDDVCDTAAGIFISRQKQYKYLVKNDFVHCAVLNIDKAKAMFSREGRGVPVRIGR